MHASGDNQLNLSSAVSYQFSLTSSFHYWWSQIRSRPQHSPNTNKWTKCWYQAGLQVVNTFIASIHDLVQLFLKIPFHLTTEWHSSNSHQWPSSTSELSHHWEQCHQPTRGTLVSSLAVHSANDTWPISVLNWKIMSSKFYIDISIIVLKPAGWLML